jgi:hypothetical protein
MPRINEHLFRIEEVDYKLTYQPNGNPIIYVNEYPYAGNKSELLRKYIHQLKLDVFVERKTTQQLSAIVLKYFSDQNIDKSNKITHQKKASQIELTKKDINKNQNSAINEKIDELLKSFDWKSLRNKTKPKLLIIGCCNAKHIQPDNLQNENFKNYDFGVDFDLSRRVRLNYYRGLEVSHFDNLSN